MKGRAGSTIVVEGFALTLLALLASFACSDDQQGAERAHDTGDASAGHTGGVGTESAGGATSGGTSSTNGGSPPSAGAAGVLGGRTGAGGSHAPNDSGAAGSAGHGAAHDGGSGGSSSGPSDLPIPPGSSSVPRPAGSVANLKVLPWAAFGAAVTYTFDDSSPSQIDHYADIDAAGVPVTFYLTTNNATSAAAQTTWKTARAAGHELGNHTVHHCYFDQACGGAPAGSSASEVDDATTFIKGTLGAPDVWTLAYPYGDTGYEPLAKDRFFLARGGGTVKPGGTSDPWNLPIFAASGGEAASVFIDRIDAARGEGSWLIFLFHSLAPDNEAWYAPVDVANVTASIDHAKSSGDTWIDTLANVGAYWIGQGLVEKAATTGSASLETWTWSVPAHFPPGRFVRVTVDGGTLSQGSTLDWNGHGFYEVSLDAGTLTWKN
jgi:peptidoglycan/xylan/chitin deacetylase (PgdA/CDA1 family)